VTSLPFLARLAPLIAALFLTAAQGPGPSRLFPVDLYQRLGDPWLGARGEEPLFTAAFQARKAEAFRRTWLGPWDPAFVAAHLTPEVAGLEDLVLDNIRRDIADQTGFGPNLRPYGPDWLARIQAQLPPPRKGPFRFRPEGRAVILDNALLRLLPTMDLYMQHPDIPGQGYPFDNLQNSVLWAGTPVYLLGATRDGSWCKVLAPDCAGWVRSQLLARAGPGFVRRWSRAALDRGLAAAVVTETPVEDRRGRFRFHAFVGSVLPRNGGRSGPMGVLIPARDPATLRARCEPGRLLPGAAVPQPWPYTPRHAAVLWKTLLGRPYGWGNTLYHNDCSAELKHFFVPFGLWLPRHSSDQKGAGRCEDLSGLGLEERLAGLERIGHPYRSLVWIQGHVMLYLGPVRYTAPDGAAAAGFMTYQNLWGLRPRNLPDYRALVGGSVLFPVLDTYPQAPDLRSLADRDRFVVTNLDEDPQGPCPGE
jgi:hypothetical protein